MNQFEGFKVFHARSDLRRKVYQTAVAAKHKKTTKLLFSVIVIVLVRSIKNNLEYKKGFSLDVQKKRITYLGDIF